MGAYVMCITLSVYFLYIYVYPESTRSTRSFYACLCVHICGGMIEGGMSPTYVLPCISPCVCTPSVTVVQEQSLSVWPDIPAAEPPRFCPVKHFCEQPFLSACEAGIGVF